MVGSMRTAIVPASAITSEGYSLTPATYLQPVTEQEQRLTAARKKYKEAIGSINAVTAQRREVRTRQRRLGIKEQ